MVGIVVDESLVEVGNLLQADDDRLRFGMRGRPFEEQALALHDAGQPLISKGLRFAGIGNGNRRKQSEEGYKRAEPSELGPAGVKTWSDGRCRNEHGAIQVPVLGDCNPAGKWIFSLPMLQELTLQDPVILFAIGFGLVVLLGFLVFFAIRAERDRMRRDIARGNEERLEMVLSGTGLGFWDWNIDRGTINIDRDWYRDNLGYEPGEIHEGRDLPGQLAHPADLDRINEGLLEHLLGKNDSYRIEFRYRHKRGSWIWVLSRGKVVMRDALGRAQRLVGADAIIESRKRGEELMALERDLAVKLGTISEIDLALRQILRIALSMEDFTVGAVYRKNPQTGDFALLDQVDLPDHFLTECGWVSPSEPLLSSGAALGAADKVAQEWGLASSLEDLAKVLAVIPLRRGDDVCGLLILGSPSAMGSSSYLKSSLDQLALQANAILLRIQTETYFRENQRNLSYLIDSIDELLFILDPHRRIVFANAVARRQIGYEQEELAGMDLLDFYPSAEKSAIEVSFKDLTSGILPFCNLALRGRDGQIISTELQVTEGRWDRKEVFI